MTRSLAEIQGTLQQSILGGGSDALCLISQPPSGHGSTADAFGVYQSAYLLRHKEFLANDYEILRQYIGESRFGMMAKAYLEATPSRHPNARWFSHKLPEFLLQNMPFKTTLEVGELAMLERALADAFDAPDHDHKSFDDMANIPPDEIHLLTMKFHPSLRILKFSQNTTSIWSALKCEEVPPRPHVLDQQQHIMVWRQANNSRFRILGDEEAMAIDSARQGVSFGVICEMIAMSDNDDTVAMRAATYLRGWFEAEILSSLDGVGTNALK